jgi:superfamily II RNA helicase
VLIHSSARFVNQPQVNSTPHVSDIDSSPRQLLSSPTSRSTGELLRNSFKALERSPLQDRPASLYAPQLAKIRSDSNLSNVFERQEIVAQTSPSTPMINGVTLVPVNRLPDRFRSIFPFALFNAVQSRCFDSAYSSTNNLVVSAPTGSGKTVILELAMCALFKELEQGTYKIVYQAPTKSLCAQRKRGSYCTSDVERPTR